MSPRLPSGSNPSSGGRIDSQVMPVHRATSREPTSWTVPRRPDAYRTPWCVTRASMSYQSFSSIPCHLAPSNRATLASSSASGKLAATTIRPSRSTINLVLVPRIGGIWSVHPPFCRCATNTCKRSMAPNLRRPPRRTSPSTTVMAEVSTSSWFRIADSAPNAIHLASSGELHSYSPINPQLPRNRTSPVRLRNWARRADLPTVRDRLRETTPTDTIIRSRLDATHSHDCNTSSSRCL